MGCRNSTLVATLDHQTNDGSVRATKAAERRMAAKMSGRKNDDEGMSREAFESVVTDRSFQRDYRIVRQVGGDVSRIYLVVKNHPAVGNSHTIDDLQSEDLKIYVMQVIDLRTVAPELRVTMKVDLLDLKSLNHPSILKICNVYNNIELNNTISLVTEVCTGQDLRMYATTPCSENKVRSIVTQILNAVNYMHKRGHFHHTLSINNIMFEDDTNKAIKITYSGLTACTKMDGVVDFLSTPRNRGDRDLRCIGLITYMLLSGGKEPPTSVDTDDEYDPQENYNGRFSRQSLFTSPMWKRIELSREAKDFVESCTLHGFLTVEQALQHRWITQVSIYMKGTAISADEIIADDEVDVDEVNVDELDEGEVDLDHKDLQSASWPREKSIGEPLVAEMHGSVTKSQGLSMDPSLSTMKYEIFVKAKSIEDINASLEPPTSFHATSINGQPQINVQCLSSDSESICAPALPAPIDQLCESSDEISAGDTCFPAVDNLKCIVSETRPVIITEENIPSSESKAAVTTPLPSIEAEDPKTPTQSSCFSTPGTPTTPQSPNEIPADLQDIREAFSDANGGVVSLVELRERLKTTYREDEVNTWIKNGNFGDNRSVRYEEFLSSIIKARRKIDIIRVEEAFQRIDKGEQGYVTVGNLRAVLGTDNSEFIEQLIKKANSKRDNKIAFDQFKEVLQQYIRTEL